ncbi:MAG: hypothetical protein K2I13_02420, partial [Alistipes sp.]|nr:hypothetical protein [Alistipes sp.]
REHRHSEKSKGQVLGTMNKILRYAQNDKGSDRMTVDSLALRTLRYIAFACLSGSREMTWRGYSSAAAGAGRIEDAGRRRWQRRALRRNLRLSSRGAEKLYSRLLLQRVECVEEAISLSVIARHRRCRGDLNKNNNRAVMIETKMFCFVQIATLVTLARNDGADDAVHLAITDEKGGLGKQQGFVQIATGLTALAMTGEVCRAPCNNKRFYGKRNICSDCHGPDGPRNDGGG